MSIMTITRNNSFNYENKGPEGKIAVHSSNSQNKHVLTTYSKIDTPKGTHEGQIVRASDNMHTADLHYNHDPERGMHFHSAYPSRPMLLAAIKSTDMAYEADAIKTRLGINQQERN